MSKILGAIGFIISILGFALDLPLPEWLRWILVVVSVIAFGIAVVLEIQNYLKNKPHSFNRQQNIDYMENIIKREGKIIVFAGDLSWVDNNRIKKAIIDKKDDLFLCVNNSAQHIQEFQNAGVKVLTYGDKDFSPCTRFTVIRKDSPDERIAITSIKDDYKKEKRLVYELQKNPDDFISNWIIYAATDLFKLTKIINDLNNNQSAGGK